MNDADFCRARALALATDSTRVMTFLVPGWSQVFTIGDQKLSAGYHGLSHHGNESQKISEYNMVGIEHVRRFESFLQKLWSVLVAALDGAVSAACDSDRRRDLAAMLRLGGGSRGMTQEEFYRETLALIQSDDLDLSDPRLDKLPEEYGGGLSPGPHRWIKSFVHEELFRFGPALDVMQITIEGPHRMDMFSRCLTEKLLTYGTGRRLGFGDRRVVNQIVADVRQEGNGFRDLILAVVQSESFCTK